METFDVKKQYHNIYSASSKRIDIVDVPKLTFLMVDGIGNPLVDEYILKAKALRIIAKEIKEVAKSQGLSYTISPLEGLWDTYDNSRFDVNRKSMIRFTLMMALPPQIDEEIVLMVKENIVSRNDNPYLLDVYLKEFQEGKSVQMLHRGPYNTEIQSTKQIMEYITVENMKLTGLHHEIYLNNPEKVAAKDLKTVVRYAIEGA